MIMLAEASRFAWIDWDLVLKVGGGALAAAATYYARKAKNEAQQGNALTREGNEAATTASLKADTAVNVAQQSAKAVQTVKTEITDPNGGSTLRGMTEKLMEEARAAREEARAERIEAREERKATRDELAGIRASVERHDTHLTTIDDRLTKLEAPKTPAA